MTIVTNPTSSSIFREESGKKWWLDHLKEGLFEDKEQRVCVGVAPAANGGHLQVVNPTPDS